MRKGHKECAVPHVIELRGDWGSSACRGNEFWERILRRQGIQEPLPPGQSA